MASKRKKRRDQCRGKAAYTDRDAAFKRAGQLRSQYPGEVFDSYRCPVCSQWHVGHRPHRVAQAIRTRKEDQ